LENDLARFRNHRSNDSTQTGQNRRSSGTDSGKSFFSESVNAFSLRDLPQRLQMGIPSVIFFLIRIWIGIRSFPSADASQFGYESIMHYNLTRA
jgi:hypothetical protein